MRNKKGMSGMFLMIIGIIIGLILLAFFLFWFSKGSGTFMTEVRVKDIQLAVEACEFTSDKLQNEAGYNSETDDIDGDGLVDYGNNKDKKDTKGCDPCSCSNDKCKNIAANDNDGDSIPIGCDVLDNNNKEDVNSKGKYGNQCSEFIKKYGVCALG